MILVTGATGHFGEDAIDFLLGKVQPDALAALARDVRKAEPLAVKGIAVREGNYFDRDSLVKAFAGIEKLLFVSSSELENRVEQHKNVIDAAKAAGVKQIVYTSVLNPPADPYFKPALDHLETERLLKESGIAHTVLRNSFYLEIFPMFIGNALESGQIAFPAGDGKLTSAARTEMAEAAANILTGEGHENKIYEIGSEEAVSLGDVAEVLSELAGRKIDYLDIPLDAFKAELVKNQTPAPLVEMFAGIAEAIKHGELDYKSADLKNLLGRKPSGLKEFLRRTYFSGAAGEGAAA
jgi:NAD(P)H dehydrogenase (quinone)